MYHSPHESPCTYVADLPPSVMYSLYEILDTQDSWKHLGEYGLYLFSLKLSKTWASITIHDDVGMI